MASAEPETPAPGLAPMLEQIEKDLDRCLPQDQSPLFGVLPAEIRNLIFEYSLAQYEDSEKRFELETYYARPDYSAPRRCDTALLRVCRRAYREAWFHPWLSSEQVFFFCSDDRRPADYGTDSGSRGRIAETLRRIQAVHPGLVEISSVRIFPQLYALEQGTSLGALLGIPDFRPRVVTITIRHTDWWFWEMDTPLTIRANWVANCAFPASVQQLRLELESIERRTPQIDIVAKAMASKWHFRRQDGALLVARVKDSKAAEKDGDVHRWRGSSTFDGHRWLRDEVAPETLEYYVRTVTFKPRNVPGPGEEREPLPAFEHRPDGLRPDMNINLQGEFKRMSVDNPSESVRNLARAGVSPGTPASEVMERMRTYHEQNSIDEYDDYDGDSDVEYSDDVDNEDDEDDMDNGSGWDDDTDSRFQEIMMNS